MKSLTPLLVWLSVLAVAVAVASALAFLLSSHSDLLLPLLSLLLLLLPFCCHPVGICCCRCLF
jgi:hypothetical protein